MSTILNIASIAMTSNDVSTVVMQTINAERTVGWSGKFLKIKCAEMFLMASHNDSEVSDDIFIKLVLLKMFDRWTRCQKVTLNFTRLEGTLQQCLTKFGELMHIVQNQHVSDVPQQALTTFFIVQWKLWLLKTEKLFAVYFRLAHIQVMMSRLYPSIDCSWIATDAPTDNSRSLSALQPCLRTVKDAEVLHLLQDILIATKLKVPVVAVPSLDDMTRAMWMWTLPGKYHLPQTIMRAGAELDEQSHQQRLLYFAQHALIYPNRPRDCHTTTLWRGLKLPFARQFLQGHRLYDKGLLAFSRQRHVSVDGFTEEGGVLLELDVKDLPKGIPLVWFDCQGQPQSSLPDEYETLAPPGLLVAKNAPTVMFQGVVVYKILYIPDNAFLVTSKFTDVQQAALNRGLDARYKAASVLERALYEHALKRGQQLNAMNTKTKQVSFDKTWLIELESLQDGGKYRLFDIRDVTFAIAIHDDNDWGRHCIRRASLGVGFRINRQQQQRILWTWACKELGLLPVPGILYTMLVTGNDEKYLASGKRWPGREALTTLLVNSAVTKTTLGQPVPLALADDSPYLGDATDYFLRLKTDPVTTLAMSDNFIRQKAARNAFLAIIKHRAITLKSPQLYMTKQVADSIERSLRVDMRHPLLSTMFLNLEAFRAELSKRSASELGVMLFKLSRMISICVGRAPSIKDWTTIANSTLKESRAVREKGFFYYQ